MALQKILILGGGQQGQIIANRLSDDFHVTIADKNQNIKLPKNVQFQYFDVTDLSSSYRKIFGKWFTMHDVVVGALPSQFGELGVSLAAEFGVDYIDLSFTEKDLSEYDVLARRSGARIIPDCGLAPGLPNLFVGHLLSGLQPGEVLKPVEIYVGGVSRNKAVPHGYVQTWSLSDLWEEYSRPGRYLENGEIKTAHPLDLDNLEVLEIPNMGKMEAFTSDGLRTLLKLKDVAPNMIEKTLRWPGHMDGIKRIMDKAGSKEKAVRQFKKSFGRGLDLVALRVKCDTFDEHFVVDGQKDLSAMAKSTGFTCAAFAKLMLAIQVQERTGTNGYIPLKSLQPGVTAPELIGACLEYYQFIKNILLRDGVLQ